MKETKYCPVTLEPELEEEAALWTAAERRAMARKLQRWARQLEISATILDRTLGPQPPPALKVVSLRKALLN